MFCSAVTDDPSREYGKSYATIIIIKYFNNNVITKNTEFRGQKLNCKWQVLVTHQDV